MDPDSCVVYPRGWKGDFTVREFCVTPEMHEQLRERLKPYLQDVLCTPLHMQRAELTAWEKRNDEIRTIVEECLPADFIESCRLSAQGRLKDPIVVYNLPEVPVNDAELYTQPYYTNIIARGCCRSSELKYEQQTRLIRKVTSDPDSPVASAQIHTDSYDMTFLAAPINTQDAPTGIVDLQGALNSLDDELLAKIHCVNYEDVTLADVKRLATRKGHHIIIDHVKSDSAALAIYEDAIARHTADIQLQPGMMLLFNYNIYHCGKKGHSESLPLGKTSRVLQFIGANRTVPSNQAL